MEMIETGRQLGLNIIYFGRIEGVNVSVDLKGTNFVNFHIV